jgi:hypothetical protein
MCPQCCLGHALATTSAELGSRKCQCAGRQIGAPVGFGGVKGEMQGFFPFGFAQGQNDKEATASAIQAVL